MSVPPSNQAALVSVGDPSRDALAFVQNPDPDALQSVLAMGDLSKITAQQRLQFLAAMCRSIGLNPLTQPFEFVSLSGKLRIYARKDCTEQLRKIHDVSVEIVNREWQSDLYIVTARARMANGRQDESIGAVSIAGKKGEDLANATMKAETKAKRRVTLSICGLGFLDESEMEGIHAPTERPARPVGDPFAAGAKPLPPAGPAWIELFPYAWGDEVEPVSGKTYGEIADGDDGESDMRRLWRDDPANPACCAWGAKWIQDTMPLLPDCEWESLQTAVPALPGTMLECSPKQLRDAAGTLAKWLAAKVKADAEDAGQEGRGE